MSDPGKDLLKRSNITATKVFIRIQIIANNPNAIWIIKIRNIFGPIPLPGSRFRRKKIMKEWKSFSGQFPQIFQNPAGDQFLSQMTCSSFQQFEGHLFGIEDISKTVLEVFLALKA